MERKQYRDIDEYIASCPKETREILKKLRTVIREAAPDAEEGISYGMPSFTLNGPLVYFAAFKEHIGFYPIPSGVAAFTKELSPYRQGKGSVQFPFDKPVPYDLVKKIVEYRAKENLARNPPG